MRSLCFKVEETERCLLYDTLTCSDVLLLFSFLEKEKGN